MDGAHFIGENTQCCCKDWGVQTTLRSSKHLANSCILQAASEESERSFHTQLNSLSWVL